MTKNQAIDKAQKLAMKSGDFYYVVLEDPEFNEYEVSTEDELHTWYLACPIVATIEPDGSIS